MASKFKFTEHTASEWASLTPAKNEYCIATETKTTLYKIGNGSYTYANLPFRSFEDFKNVNTNLPDIAKRETLKRLKDHIDVIDSLGVGGGTAQAQTITYTQDIVLTVGKQFTYTPSVSNTATAPTININGLGAKTVILGTNVASGTALIASDITINVPCIIIYDGINFRLQNPQNTPAASVKVTPVGGIVATNVQDALAEIDGEVSELELYTCKSITEDKEKGLYVVDPNGHVVFEINSNGAATTILSAKKIATNNIESFESINSPVVTTQSIEDRDSRLSIIDSKGNEIAKFDKEGLHAPSFGSNKIKINDDYHPSVEVVDEHGNVICSISKNGIKSTRFIAISDGHESREYRAKDDSYSFVGEKLLEIYGKPRISWIDDDFYDDDENGESFNIIKQWGETNNSFIDFAFIPDPERSEESIQRVLSMDSSGFHFLVHPVHRGWRYESEERPHNLELVKSSLLDAIKRMKEIGFTSSLKILVWPGNSGNSELYPDNLDFVKKYMDCAIMSTHHLSNHNVEYDRYHLKRISLDAIGTINTAIEPSGNTITKQMIKDLIKKGYDNNDWVIIMSHAENWNPSMQTDDVSQNMGNFIEVLDYANTLFSNYGGIRPTEEVWNERRIIFDYFGK